MSPLRSSAALHRMRVIFAGTPGFAAEALTAILSAGHDVPLVLTQPDRPAGRHQRLTASPVKAVAQAEGLPLHQPERLRTPEQQAPVLAVPADVMVVAAYGLILPPPVLNHPAHGCLNIHASLLPRWRGAAPIQRALLAGDAETGISVTRSPLCRAWWKCSRREYRQEHVNTTRGRPVTVARVRNTWVLAIDEGSEGFISRSA